MMRTTTLLLLGAAALYFGALATPSPEDLTPLAKPLDFEGIRTLEVRAPHSVRIVLSARAADVTWGRSTPEGVQVERIGDTLRLTAGAALYGSVEVHAPHSLSGLVVQDAEVVAEGRAGRLAIDVRGSLDWSGDAEALDIRHVGAACAKGDCPDVRVESGADTELSVSAEFADLHVHLPARTQAARIQLGSCASLDLGDVRRLDAVVVEALPPRACPDPEATRPTAPARIAP